MADLARCAVCGERLEPEHTVAPRTDAATGEAQLLHAECSGDGITRALRLGRDPPVPPGTWDRWNGENGAQQALDAFDGL